MAIQPEAYTWSLTPVGFVKASFPYQLVSQASKMFKPQNSNNKRHATTMPTQYAVTSPYPSCPL
jgi:hypothetical protein